MNHDERSDDLPEDEFIQGLLGSLEDDFPTAPETLADRAIRKIQAELTGRDLLDLTTFVFLMRFCAPLLDLLAAFFGHDPTALDPSGKPGTGAPTNQHKQDPPRPQPGSDPSSQPPQAPLAPSPSETRDE